MKWENIKHLEKKLIIRTQKPLGIIVIYCCLDESKYIKHYNWKSSLQWDELGDFDWHIYTDVYKMDD